MQRLILGLILYQNAERNLISLSGIVVDGDPKDNLVMKAYHLLAERFDMPAVQIYLDKNIPFGAGLGGGSSDAAFMLRLLRDKFDLPVENEELLSLSVKL